MEIVFFDEPSRRSPFLLLINGLDGDEGGTAGILLLAAHIEETFTRISFVFHRFSFVWAARRLFPISS